MRKRITPPGVYRSGDGKHWTAFVVASAKKLKLLGDYPTIAAAVAARTNYWKARPDREPAAVAVLKKIQRRVGKKLPSKGDRRLNERPARR
jgi:hypothetical protein